MLSNPHSSPPPADRGALHAVTTLHPFTPLPPLPAGGQAAVRPGEQAGRPLTQGCLQGGVPAVQLTAGASCHEDGGGGRGAALHVQAGPPGEGALLRSRVPQPDGPKSPCLSRYCLANITSLAALLWADSLKADVDGAIHMHSHEIALVCAWVVTQHAEMRLYISLVLHYLAQAPVNSRRHSLMLQCV